MSKTIKRRGVAIIEFAFAVPVLLLFLFAGLEFGRIIMIRHTADNAAYEAARVAMVPGATVEEAKNKASQILSTVGVRSIDVQVEPEELTPETTELSVTIIVPVAENSWVVPKFFTGSTIQATSRLATERYNLD